MYAKWNRNTFTIEVDPQAESLSAGYELDPKTGLRFPVKWFPCSQCGRMEKVAYNVVSFFCCNACEDVYSEEHPSQQSEIQGYSHACGYHD
jgi:hypothetical protein